MSKNRFRGKRPDFSGQGSAVPARLLDEPSVLSWAGAARWGGAVLPAKLRHYLSASADPGRDFAVPTIASPAIGSQESCGDGGIVPSVSWARAPVHTRGREH